MKEITILISFSEERNGIELHASANFEGKAYSIKKFYEGASIQDKNWSMEALNLISDEIGKDLRKDLQD